MELPRGDMNWLDHSEPDPYAMDHDPGDSDDYSQLVGRWHEDEFNQPLRTLNMITSPLMTTRANCHLTSCPHT